MGEPMKFEAGMVVRFDGLHIPGGNELVVRGVDKGDIWCVGAVDRLAVYKLQLSEWGPRAVLLSPSPRAGDTWTSGESVARIEANGAQLRIVSEREPFVGDVVAVARRLWEGGYRMTDATYGRPMARTLRDGRTAYVTLDDMKECVPASLAAYDGTWPVFTPSAEVDGGIHPTRDDVEWAIESLRAAEQRYAEAKRAYPREYDGEFREPPPRAGDVYEHADGTIVEICEREWRPGLRTHVLRAAVTCPLLVEADEPALLAAMLREHGYTRRDGKWRVYESRDRLSASGAAEAIQRVSGYGVPISADDIRERFGLPQARIDATTPQSALGRARADRVTSRRNVDAAVARLRGEPFARAIQAALAGVSERANLTPAEVAAAIAAMRHWEARRPFGGVLRPEAHASLSRSSTEALRGALGYAPVWDTDLLFSTYERARSSR